MRAMIGSTDVVLDAAAAYPEIAGLRAALRRRDWPACRALLDQLEPTARSAALQSCAGELGLEEFLRGVLAADVTDAAAAALLGHHLIHVGWEIRSGQYAKHVGARQFDRFHDWLRRAELVLIDAAARHPKDPAIWTARLLTARGLQLGLAEARRRLDRAVAAQPHHLPAQLQFLQSACPKWDGTWEVAHEFARDAMLAAPPGSPHAVLVVHAHVEHIVGDDDTDVVRYLADDTIRAGIYEAAHRSIWHPEFRRGPGWVQAFTAFALIFTMLDDRRSAATAFAGLGTLAAEYPWNQIGSDVSAQIREARAWAYEEAV
ncbi:hypothetical protein BC793_115220 [Actinoplanes xinjiangensis]|uniref:DUF4034 domain-containing protein n=2 Tax=Actinoplanes xinjiangensis TaxID=512350 RepID=A0A316F8A4_9ACTN|nr:hypothetical protein BC793_115220 [Actinoplanes xinjiangensis]GIF41265.1 hypothetical protein Axi01nite_55760 [Actinoplanes xinjiangensis]